MLLYESFSAVMIAMVLSLLFVTTALAANPLVPGVGMADTNVHYFDGKFVIFATHDFSIHNTGFRMDGNDEKINNLYRVNYQPGHANRRLVVLEQQRFD